jgi:nucleotide-binding universal stress UspA family protein
MFKHILVPLDGSKLAEAILPIAFFFASKFKAPVTLLHVIEQDAPDEVHRDRHLTEVSEAEEYLKGISLSFIKKRIKVNWHVHTAPVANVARSIIDHSADEYQPDLILLCAHGNSGMHDLFFGNIAQQVSAASNASVLLIKPRKNAAPFNIRSILLPLDNESIHDKAIPFAEELATSCKAQLNLLCVIPTLGTLTGEQAATGNLMPSATSAFLDINEEIAVEHFQAHLNEFQHKGIKATASIDRGDPATVIAKTAEANLCDLIIFGSHGHTGLDAFWNRSVAASVGRKLMIPLLLIPLRN